MATISMSVTACLPSTACTKLTSSRGGTLRGGAAGAGWPGVRHPRQRGAAGALRSPSDVGVPLPGSSRRGMGGYYYYYKGKAAGTAAAAAGGAPVGPTPTPTPTPGSPLCALGALAMAKSVLVTGGAGYIGSHTVLQLLLGGYRAVVVDNLDNSSEVAVRRVADLAGDCAKNLAFHQVDLRNKEALEKIFVSTKFDAVIHFAGLKAVGESVQKPLMYYNNNLISTINLLEVMGAHGCKKLVFSSSATVYGWPKEVPCTEEFPLCAMNPYGRTKLFIEEMCRDVYHSDSGWSIILLRYFNPVGAHPSGHIGEDPRGIPNNLMPYIQQVAVGRRAALTVFGNDYSTKDGTGVRDYIHVVDLSDGHIAALQKLLDGSNTGCEVYNLGTGKGMSVLEMVSAFEKASGKKIPLIFAGRRPGDAEIIYASTAKAERELNWKAKYGIDEICRDLWNWASKNPWGYGSPDSAN